MAENSLDAVSGRDFALDYLSAAATCATHLSRLGAELVLWSSSEFGFCELSDSWSSSSSLMPQKKNPDAAELLRAKAPRVVAHLTALHGVIHALPLAYNKDLQEDKEHLFDTSDTLELCLAAARGMLAGARFNREAMGSAAADELVAATDVADLLVRLGTPFREAHGIVAGLVRGALQAGKPISELDEQELAAHSELLAAHREELLQVLSPGGALESKVSEGGTATARVAEQLALARGALERIAGDMSAARAAVPAARAGGASRGRDRRGARGGPMGAGFYERPVLEVARDLIGCRVVHGSTEGVIVETEAYHHSEPASHAFVGLTPRTSTLFGAPGRAYVYRSYGIHAMLNAVCEPEGVGAAVLIRALAPLGGVELMRERRGGTAREQDLCSGPGKLTQALGIELDDNGSDLAMGPVRILPRASDWPGARVLVGTRVGINHAVELPWRFAVAGDPNVSRPRPHDPLAARGARGARGGPSRPA